MEINEVVLNTEGVTRQNMNDIVYQLFTVLLLGILQYVGVFLYFPVLSVLWDPSHKSQHVLWGHYFVPLIGQFLLEFTSYKRPPILWDHLSYTEGVCI